MKSDDKNEKEILSGLVINTREWLQRIVSEARSILGIDNETGSPVILAPYETLVDRDRIVLYLVGKYLSYRMDKSGQSSATLKELSQSLGIPYTVVKARVAELRRNTIEGVRKGEVKILLGMIERAIVEINAKITRHV